MTDLTSPTEFATRLTSHKGRVPHRHYDNLSAEEVAEKTDAMKMIQRKKDQDSAPYAIVGDGKGGFEVHIPASYAPCVKGFVKSCAERSIAKMKQIERMRAKLKARG